MVEDNLCHEVTVLDNFLVVACCLHSECLSFAAVGELPLDSFNVQTQVFHSQYSGTVSALPGFCV